MTHENYQIIRHPNWSAYTLKSNKGRLPKALTGLFTTPEIAIKAIDQYIKSKVK